MMIARKKMNNEYKDTNRVHVDCDTLTDIFYALRDKGIPLHSPEAYKFVAEEYGYTQENSDISL